jgi:SAM-dependent methyltransferase
MKSASPELDGIVLSRQREHWKATYSSIPDMFGEAASDAGRKAAEVFKQEGKTKLLELGAGQGRDTFFFAQGGFEVCAVDYCGIAVGDISRKAETLGLSQSITAVCHDVREPLPFDDESFDACYSHMLYCMALTTSELEFLSGEVRRVLRPGGICIYTVRHTNDAHYGTGIHRGEDMYEVDGFIVHFFSREKVEHLAKGYEILSIDEFEEGGLPRQLFRVALGRK